jgi:hypothetical protein
MTRVPLTVGQELWLVPDRGLARAVKVVKVGRKWADLDNRGRVDMATMALDGGEYSSPGRCYLSRDEHDREVELRIAWAYFAGLVCDHRRTPPEGVSVSQIENAQRALFKKGKT